jgi:cystathionine beta-lyase
MKYDFDNIINRKGTNSIKWDAGDLLKKFGITERFDDDSISLFVADMDFQCPQPVLDALHKRVDQMMFGYSTHVTTDEYNEAVQSWFKRRHNWDIPAESIVYCPGTVYALHMLIRSFTKEGDGIIIQRPVYRPFMTSVEENGRKVVSNSLIETDGYYSIDFEDLEAKAKDANNTMMILCSPHNPVGRVWTKEELIKMAEICLSNDVVLIADEIHGDLIRKDQTHYPLCNLVNDDRIISCTAINKTFNTAGLHCSNIIVNNEEMRKRFMKELGMKMPSPFSISALIAAYNEGEDWLRQVNEYIDGNLQFLKEFLDEHMPLVKYRIPEGTYIAWLDFRSYGLSSEEVHDRIYNKANVVLEDGELFGPEGTGFQRICIPSPRALIKEALERIHEQFKEFTK